jgi:hypothetical protein
MSNDDKPRDRDAILARRRFFVASAVAGVVATACERSPMVCLEVAPVPASGADAGPPPRPCLEIPPPDDASSAATENAAGSDAAADATSPRPHVCLKVGVPPKDQR